VGSLPENLDEDLAIGLIRQGVVPLMGLDSALGAIKAAQTPAGVPGWRPVATLPARDCRLLSEAEGKALLAAAGVPVPKGVQGVTLAEVQAQAGALTAPLALKGLGFAHKTEAGAVRLGLATLDGQAGMPGATGYLAEEMVTGAAAELLLGLRRDPVYGVTLTLGMGGVTAEVLADTVTLVLPVTEAEVLAAARRLRLWPLLDGYRGRPKADMAAVADIAVRLGALMLADPELEEIELNPVLARTTGAVAVDALIRRA
jgi:acetate---CoA ligase (ADP-forming)